MTAYKTTELNKLIPLFQKKSRFYNAKLKGCKDFFEVPFTEKKELLESQIKQPAYGDFTNDKCLIEQVYRTSGTHSNPLVLAFSKADIKLMTEIGKECLQYAGMGQQGNNEIVINCLNYSMWTGGAFDALSIAKTGVQLVNYGAGNTRSLINFIHLLKKDKKIRISLHCTPSYLTLIEKLLIEEFNQKPHELGISAFYTGGESGIQNEEFRKKYMSVWKSKVLNANYGMSEVSSTMASANEYNYLRFSPIFLKNYLVELANPTTTQFLTDAKTGDWGELIITTLYKQCQPLIRYNTREIVKIVKKRGAEIFFEILSRSDDMLVYKGINIFPEQFRTVLSMFDELSGRFKLRIKKEDNNLVSKIVIVCEKAMASNPDIYQLEKQIKIKIKEALSINPEVIIVNGFNIEGNKLKIIDYI